MKFEDDDLKDGKLWAALQKEIDRDLAEKESGETFQEELADIFSGSDSFYRAQNSYFFSPSVSFLPYPILSKM